VAAPRDAWRSYFQSLVLEMLLCRARPQAVLERLAVQTKIVRGAAGAIAITALLAGCGEITASSNANHGGFTLSKAGFYEYALSGCLKPTIYSATAWTPDFQLHGRVGRRMAIRTSTPARHEVHHSGDMDRIVRVPGTLQPGAPQPTSDLSAFGLCLVADADPAKLTHLPPSRAAHGNTFFR
jgi:hypothetical protein